MVERQPTVLAVLREDQHAPRVRRVALDRARADGARLVLYDLDASPSPLESPLPTNWSADGAEDEFGALLGPGDLEAAGRASLAEAVRGAREAGLDATAWLPESDDVKELAEFARSVGAHVVVVSAEDADLVGELDLPTEIAGA